MANPQVDTFEHDIANEIRHKEASIADIASAVGDIGNTEVEQKKGSPIIGIVVIVVACVLIGVGYVGYTYYQKTTTPLVPSLAETVAQEKIKESQQLSLISPSLNQAVGASLGTIQKTGLGYSISIISYSPVFSYMIKNEHEFGDELGLALGNSHTLKTVNSTSTKTTSTSTPVVVATTTVATNTPSTTTPLISEDKGVDTNMLQETSTTYIFSDITISNQNMRIAKTIYGTVVYAFIGNQKLVISSSTEGILSLRNNILHK